MKNCTSFEKKITAYLHGELAPAERAKLDAHLESCACCRAALDDQRQTLDLLGATLAAAPARERLILRDEEHALEAAPALEGLIAQDVEPTPEVAPAPERLIAREMVPPWERRRENPFSRFLFSARFPAVLAASAIHLVIFALGGMLVVFNVVTKEEKSFVPPGPVERPKLSLKKPQIKVKKSSEPESTTRIVTKVKRANIPDVQLPEMAGSAGESNGEMDGYDLMPGMDSLTMIGLSLEAEDDLMRETIAPVSGVNDYSFESKDVSRPQLALKKLQVPVNVSKSTPRPKLRKQIVVNGIAGISVPEIDMPQITGVRGGIGGMDTLDIAGGVDDLFGTDSESDSVDGDLFGWAEEAPLASPAPARTLTESEPATLTDDLFGVDSDSAESAYFAWAEEAPAPAKPESGVLADGFLQMEEAVQEGQAFAGVTTVVSSSMLGYSVADASESLRDESLLRRSGVDKDAPVKRDRTFKPAVFNPYMLAAEHAFSTFSIDVDTASYGLARNQLLSGGLPEPEQVRTEEFINSFDYDYRPPTGKQTFAVHTEMAPSPFRLGMDVLKVGIKGRRIGRDDNRGAVLTLVIDTSGSMATPERLGLVKESLALMIEQLNPEDRVAIVQFGGEARLVLEHTPASEIAVLLDAINSLQSGGPTQFDLGLELGYQLATTGFRPGDSNRIMIMSDGVANLGELDPEAILEQVAEQRKKGIYLSVLGFGAGTYDDDLLERLANKGDGMYAYIDTLNEAQHLLVDQLAATLHVIASDVKIQIEFNPERVLRYRQLGYENRQLTKEQFRDDTVDAGEVGSGQSVTALYDIELKADGPENEPIATVYVRYRRVDNGSVEEISSRVMESARVSRFSDADVRFQLAACTAEFAERLRRSPYTEGTEMGDIINRLQPVALELDIDSLVQELLRLMSIADGLE